MADQPQTVNADEWETIEREAPTQVVFDTIGDEFIGRYIGSQNIELPDSDGDTFRQDTFEGGDGEIYAINPGFQLREVLDRVQPGNWVRITYKKDVDTGQPSPMKSFQVDVRKS